jgi:hypothetical protein
MDNTAHVKERLFMHIENSYEIFLDKLRQLRFSRVSLLVVKRENLISFRAKNGTITTVKDPWFGEARAQFTDAEWEQTQAEYSYYYGKVDNNTAFFCKKSRTDHTTCFLPTHIPVEHRYQLPRPGHYIFGHVSDGSEGPRFEWWDRIEEADVRLVGLLLGTMTFSKEKLEKKLTINMDGYTDRTPFLLAKALYFRDVDYFVNLMEKGESSRGHGQGQGIYHWLYEKTSDLLPEFWEEFKIKTLVR